ncbi:MAG: LamG-like jellyroll fold domain-containing protein [Methylococcales bacterium]
MYTRYLSAGFILFLFSDALLAGNVNLAWDASSSPNVGGYIVSYGKSTSNYESIDVGNKTTHALSGLTDGSTYYFAVKAYDTARTTESSYSNQISLAIPATTASVPTPVPTAVPVQTTGSVTIKNGLVAAFGFEESNGTTVLDASGNSNNGIITEAVRIETNTTYGKALKFDGLNDLVTVNDSASLDFTTGMTLEAWVLPENLTGFGKTVILKEKSGGAVYNLYANEDSNVPVSSFNDGDYRIISAPSQLPANQLTHIASTYDGQYQRLYVNGGLVAQQSQNGQIEKSNGVLSIGGNSIWGEFFEGYIDDVRIYNRALTASEISNDLANHVSSSNTPSISVQTAEPTPPSVTNSAQFTMGNTTIEPKIDSNPQGLAEAFQTTPQKSGVVSTVRVYLDASSTATELVAGIYSENNGHPGNLVAQGKLSNLKAGAWNSVPIPTASVSASQTYWIAILGSKGDITFRDRMGSGDSNMETNASTSLTSLPDTWSTGSVYLDSPMSVYGIGN